MSRHMSPRSSLDDDDDVPNNVNWKDQQAEQAKRLLPFSEIHDSVDGKINIVADDGKPPVATAKRGFFRARNLVVAVAVASLLLLASLFFVGQRYKGRYVGNQVIDYKETIPEEVTPQNFRRPASDYILDSNWNFGARPATRRYNWTVSDAEANPDGVFRPMMLINGRFPGPLIECNEGDTLEIEVDNQSVNATSLHWHGIYQNGSSWMDGTVGVTQCPIAPGGKFLYRFTVTSQSGTYWYHSHQVLQSADGLVGPFVIHSAKEKEYQKIEYSTDRILMLQDYYHDSSYALLPDYLANGRENVEPIPAGSLINGANIRDCSELPDRKCDNTTAGIPSIDLAPNQNHRLRIINTGVMAEFQLELDEHSFAVTEVDGTNVLPSYIQRLIINPAQRYSLIVSTNLTTKDSFWMRTRMATDCYDQLLLHETPEIRPETNFIVRYREPVSGESVTMSHSLEEPSSQAYNDPILQMCKDLDPTDLVPIPAIAAPEEADHFFYMYANFMIGNWRLSRGFFNDSSYRPDIHSPILNRFVDGSHSGNESFLQELNGVNGDAFHNKTEMVIQVEGVKTVDLVIHNLNEGNHPMHLHGHKFWIMAQGHDWFRKDKSLGGKPLNTTNPLRRDTASVEGYGWTWIRFVTDNPGAWAFHCHVSWHAEAGLQMIFLTRPEVLRILDVPQANRDLCLAPGIEKGKGIDDSVYFGIFPPK